MKCFLAWVFSALVFFIVGLFASQFDCIRKCPVISKLVKADDKTIPPCGCGCMVTGVCKCKNCMERTADPNWKPTAKCPCAAPCPCCVACPSKGNPNAKCPCAAKGTPCPCCIACPGKNDPATPKAKKD